MLMPKPPTVHAVKARSRQSVDTAQGVLHSGSGLSPAAATLVSVAHCQCGTRKQQFTRRQSVVATQRPKQRLTATVCAQALWQ
jgi:hypothetical protein